MIGALIGVILLIILLGVGFWAIMVQSLNITAYILLVELIVISGCVCEILRIIWL